MDKDTASRVVSASYVLNAEVLEKFRKDFPERNSLYLLITGIGLIAFYLLGRNHLAMLQPKLVGLGIFLVLMRPLSIWTQTRQISRFGRLYPKQITYGFTFSENGCQFSKDGVEKEYGWSHIRFIQQTSAYFLIWRKGHKRMRWLPRSAFASDEDVALFLDYAKQSRVKIRNLSVDGSLIYTLLRSRPKRIATTHV